MSLGVCRTSRFYFDSSSLLTRWTVTECLSGDLWFIIKVRKKTTKNHLAMSSSSGIQIPSRLPLLLTHEGVLLPGSTMRISVDSARNMQLVRSRLLKGTSLKSTIIGVIPDTRDPEQDSEELPSLHRSVPAGSHSVSKVCLTGSC